MAIEDLEYGLGKMYRTGPDNNGYYLYQIPIRRTVRAAGKGEKEEKFIVWGSSPAETRAALKKAQGSGWQEYDASAEDMSRYRESQRQAGLKNFDIQEFQEAGITPPTTTNQTKGPLDDLFAKLKTMLGLR